VEAFGCELRDGERREVRGVEQVLEGETGCGGGECPDALGSESGRGGREGPEGRDESAHREVLGEVNEERRMLPRLKESPEHRRQPK
jgi:hypothetical protein